MSTEAAVSGSSPGRQTPMRPEDYVDLDEPHTPWPLRIVGPHRQVLGSAELRMTKREWCAQLALWAKGLDEVTDEMLRRHDLTRREYDEFRTDHIHALAAVGRRRELESLTIEQPLAPTDD